MKLIKTQILKVGDHTASNGQYSPVTYGDLLDAYRFYDPNVHEAPVIIGHSSDAKVPTALPNGSLLTLNNDTLPAFGWIKKIEIIKDELIGYLEIQDILWQWIQEGWYKFKSISLYPENNPFNPFKGKGKSIRHLAILGATPPAIKGLGSINPESLVPLDYSETEDFCNFSEIVEVSEDFKVNTFQQLDDFEESEDSMEGINSTDLMLVFTELLEAAGFMGTVAKFDPEPSEENDYLYNDETNEFSGFFEDTEGQDYIFSLGLDEAGDYVMRFDKTEEPVEDDDMKSFSDGSDDPDNEDDEEDQDGSDYSEPEDDEDSEEDEDSSVDEKSSNPQYSELIEQLKEAQLALELQQQVIQEQEAILNAQSEAEIASFCEEIYAAGKLTEGQFAKDDLVYLMTGAASGSGSLQSFSEDVEDSFVYKLKLLLDSLKPQVTFGEMTASDSQKTSKLPRLPKNAVVDTQGQKNYAAVLEYCEKNGLDPKKPRDFQKASAKVLAG